MRVLSGGQSGANCPLSAVVSADESVDESVEESVLLSAGPDSGHFNGLSAGLSAGHVRRTRGVAIKSREMITLSSRYLNCKTLYLDFFVKMRQFL
jgi:hypothetical protein